MDFSLSSILPVALLVICVLALAIGLLVVGIVLNPIRRGAVKEMPYESGMDPIHDARRRFDVRFYLLAIAFLVFDVELLFLYPWAVAVGGNDELRMMNDELPAAQQSGVSQQRGDASGIHHSSFIIHHSPTPCPPSSALGLERHTVFVGAMTFLALLVLGFVYDWRKGVFQWQ